MSPLYFELSEKIRYKDTFINHIICHNKRLIFLECDNSEFLNFDDLDSDLKKEIRDSYPECFI